MRTSSRLARMKAMDLDQAREVLRSQHRAVFCALKPDGTPSMSPVLVALDDNGDALVSTRATAYKTKQVQRNPHVSLCVLPDSFFGRWIQINGTATVVELPEAMDLLVEYYRTISGEHSDWNDYRAAMEREQRVVLRVSLTSAGPGKTG
ncbi:PPOX class F420-dependent oxidoreductase [Lentzea sp. DG1S-22]|uniref:PPOX class F420-dependent oxidoreductase n=1 Tax=Lentzea sp. DG1S-22 TaxID=3108822 RepID=UPI002E78B670|nr:PPOX class F420-dependent oxidoreductase [Lentzea sp. DG1S-22]WVH79240.1 PPOX class F420-dependent oxidoreductase [Lentzea sp. DG1S-22]